VTDRAVERVGVGVRPLETMLPRIPCDRQHFLLLLLPTVVEKQNRGVTANVRSVEEGCDAFLGVHPVHNDLVGVGYHPDGDEVANNTRGPKCKGISELEPGGRVSQGV